MEKKKERGFNEKNNQAIINLIRRKKAPLQQGRKLAAMKHYQKSRTAHHSPEENHLLPILPSAKIYNSDCEKENKDEGLLQRVREAIEFKRRESHLPEPKNELEKYIQIFERPISQKERLKRQSIQLSIIEISNKDNQVGNHDMIGFNEENVDLNDNHRSLLNAKIRRKLNHKKLIDMNRRN